MPYDLMPDDTSPWGKLLRQQSPQNPFDAFMGQMGRLPQRTRPPMPSSMMATNPVASARKDKVQKDIYKITDLKSLPSLDAQTEGLAQLRQQLGNYIQQQDVSPLQMTDLKPLAALADAWNPGSHLAASYTRPQNLQERQAQNFAAQDKIQSAQKDLTKEQADFMRDKLYALVGIDRNAKESAPYQMMAQRKMDEVSHRQILKTVQNDKDLNEMYRRSRQMANADAILENPDIAVTPQQFHESQFAVRRALGVQGTSTFSERDKTFFHTLGLKAADMEQWFYGEPQDLKITHAEFIKHLTSLTKLIQERTQAQAEKRFKAKMAGQESMYERNPDLYQDILDLKEATLDQFKDLPASSDSVKSAPSEVNGYTKQMTPEEIKAEFYRRNPGAQK